MLPASVDSAHALLRAWRARVREPLNWALGLGVASGLLLIAQAWLFARVIDRGVVGHWSLARSAPELAWLLPVFGLRFMLVRQAERAGFSAGIRVREALRAAFLDKLQRLGPLWLQTQARGDLLNSAVNGIEALEGYYARYVPAVGISALVPLAIVVAVLPADWPSAAVLLLTAPLIPLFMVLLGKAAHDANQRQWTHLTRLSARFLDTLQGLSTLKLLGASRREAQVVEQVSQDLRRSTMQVLRVAFLSTVMLEFLATISIAVVAVLIGFRLLWGQVHLQQAFFVLLLAPEYYAPLRQLGSAYHVRMQAVAAAQGLQTVFEQPEAQPVLAGTRHLPREAVDIAFDGVDFAYTAQRPALQGCSFQAPAGRVTAIVGASGCGKSTVLALTLGLARAQRGVVRLGGVPLEQLDPGALSGLVAWVPQRPHVFAASVADNIRLARAADAQQVQAAARAAGAHDFIQALPQGYATLLGEDGAGLSGGQLQRLALARALLSDAPVLLLDEPTAHLDPRTEQAVLQDLSQVCRGRTVLLVAHRLRSVALADHLVVFEHGRVVQSGAPRELARQPGLYASLVAAAGGPA